jgi:hypothetical protein
LKGELKDKVARGVAWSMAEKIGTVLLQTAVSFIILRLLTRDILGVMAILTAAAAVALVIVDGGFSQALIRKKDPSPGDYKSVFVFNIVISLVLYVLCVALAFPAARFYGIPELAQIAPIFFLQLPVAALCSVQNTIYVRQFRFALLSKVTFASWFVAGLAAIALALAGMGIWSLVVQRVVQVVVRAVLLWWLSDWRPRGECSREPLREMAPFSLGVMTSDVISTSYNRIPQFILGRLYPIETLGSFDQAVKLKDLPSTSAMQAVQNVTYPALAKIKNDAPKFAESYRQVVMVVSYVMFPIMLGLSAIAHDMFAVLLGEEWMPTVPYFEAVCLAGLFYPMAMISYNVLKVKCEGGKLIVKLEVVKKLIMTAVFAVTIPWSVQAVVWGLVVISFMEMVVNFLVTTRFTSFTSSKFAATLLPPALIALAMYAAVHASTLTIPDNALLRLLVEVVTGIASYSLLSALFRLEAFGEVMAIVRRQFKRK